MPTLPISISYLNKKQMKRTLLNRENRVFSFELKCVENENECKSLNSFKHGYITYMHIHTIRTHTQTHTDSRV